MVEAIGIPLLVKAVDFLFEEGKNILKGIRARRKESEDTVQPSVDVKKQPVRECATMSKEQVLSKTISLKMWSDSEKEIEHILRLLELDTRAYRLAEESYKMYGRALVPLIIVNRLIEAEKGVEETTKRLKDALSKVYEEEIIIS